MLLGLEIVSYRTFGVSGFQGRCRAGWFRIISTILHMGNPGLGIGIQDRVSVEVECGLGNPSSRFWFSGSGFWDRDSMQACDLGLCRGVSLF